MPYLIHRRRSLAYAVRGAGPPVLLIHGLGSSRRDWEVQVDHLAARWLVVTPDLRGHGQSSNEASPYSMGDLAGDVLALADHLELGPCHVVGLSLGGMIAFQMAVDAPHAVRSLTVVNSGPDVVPRTLRQWFLVKTRVLGARFLSMDHLARAIGKGLFPHAEQEELRETFRDRFSRNERASYRAALGAIVGWSVRDRIGSIEVPTLVVTGDRDYTPVALKYEYAALIPDASVVTIVDSGHATPIDRPEEFNAVLSEFLIRVEAAPPRSAGVPRHRALEEAL